MARIKVYVEATDKKTFACALDWPGWVRAGKNEELAIESLSAYEARYAPVAKAAGLRWPASLDFDVVERLTGGGATDFGVLDKQPKADSEKLTAVKAGQQTAILQASWKLFDSVVACAPAGLRKGPRGGGRDRDKVVEHVLSSEASYVRSIGISEPKASDLSPEAVEHRREQVIALLSAASDGSRLTTKGWSPRYALRRFTWHMLDHTWEIEDKSD